VKAFVASGLASIDKIEPDDILGYKQKLIDSTDYFGTDVEALSLTKICKMFGYSITKPKMKCDDGKRRLGLLIAKDNTTLYDKLKTHWLAKDLTKAESYKEFKATQEQRSNAAQQDKGIIVRDTALDMTYTNLSTRAKHLIGAIAKCEYTIVTRENIHEFDEWINTLEKVAIDCETAANDPDNKMGGLDYTEGHIELIQLSNGKRTWIIRKTEFKLVQWHMQLLLQSETIQKVGHNISFDARFLRAQFKIRMRNLGDTMIAAKCLLGDYGAAKIIPYSLKSLCFNFLGIEIDKTEQKSDWSKELTDEQLQYAADDAYYTFLLDEQLCKLLADPSIMGFDKIPALITENMYLVESKFLDVVQHMEENGYTLNRENVERAIDERVAKLQELNADWIKLMGDVKVTQVKQICNLLSARYNHKIDSVARKAVYTIDIPEIKLRKQIDALTRDLNVLNLLSGRYVLNPVITSLSGTGRTSVGNSKVNKLFAPLHGIAARTNPAIDPAWKLTPLRSCFKVTQIIDLPASHAHISANLAQDPNAIAALSDSTVDNHCVIAVAVAKAIGLDMDVYTAEYIKANKKSGICKQLRDTAKNSFYGWLNGAGAATIQKQIQANLGIAVTLSNAAIALDGMKDFYKLTTEYVMGKIQELKDNVSVINGKLVGHMVVEGQLISWVVGNVGDAPNPSPTKATGAIWSRLEATMMKKSGIEILDLIEQKGMNGVIHMLNHDDYNMSGDEAFKIASHEIMQRNFSNLCPATGLSAFCGASETYLKSDGVTPITLWSDK
jgi:hypothetical protein